MKNSKQKFILGKVLHQRGKTLNSQAFETTIFPMKLLRPKGMNNHIRTFSQGRSTKERYLGKIQCNIKKPEVKQNMRGECAVHSLRFVGVKTVAGTTLRSPVCKTNNVIVLHKRGRKRYTTGENTNKDLLSINLYNALKAYSGTNKTFDFSNNKGTRRDNNENELQVYKFYELTEDVFDLLNLGQATLFQ